MNKLTKIGASALCGSLAAVSAAHAGSMSVTGGATVTYTQLEGKVTGNPLGMASALTFRISLHEGDLGRDCCWMRCFRAVLSLRAW